MDQVVFVTPQHIADAGTIVSEVLAAFSGGYAAQAAAEGVSAQPGGDPTVALIKQAKEPVFASNEEHAAVHDFLLGFTARNIARQIGRSLAAWRAGHGGRRAVLSVAFAHGVAVRKKVAGAGRQGATAQDFQDTLPAAKASCPVGQGGSWVCGEEI
jgi:hypothetical protein